eukprot:gene5664-10904_t
MVLKEIDMHVSEGVYDAIEMQRHMKKVVASGYPEQSTQLENCRLAKAESVVQYHRMLHELRESSIWKDSPALQQWFSNQWLPEYKNFFPDSYIKMFVKYQISPHIQSIQAANVIKREHIALKPDRSIEVQSVQALLRFRTYQVSFGNENTMPSCQCESWQLNLLPCKHIFAVTLRFPGYSWYSLPAGYRESPFCRRDDLHVVPKVTSHPMSLKKPNDDPFMSALVRDEETSSFEEEMQTSVIEEASTSGNAGNLPKSRSARLNVASECGDYLSQIQNLTFLITAKHL